MLHHIFLNIRAQLQTSFSTSSFIAWRLCCSRLIRFKWRWVIKASSSESGVLTAVCGSKMEESQCFMSVTLFWRRYAFKNNYYQYEQTRKKKRSQTHGSRSDMLLQFGFPVSGLDLNTEIWQQVKMLQTVCVGESRGSPGASCCIFEVWLHRVRRVTEQVS